MEVVIAPYRVTDIDSNEARVVSNVKMIEEDDQSYTLCFATLQAYSKACLSIHSVCTMTKSDNDLYVVIHKDSLMAVLV